MPTATQTLKFVGLAFLCASITFILILFMVPDSPAQEYLIEFMEWIKTIPVAYGSFLLTFIYAISMVFCFPGTPFNLAAGFLFGKYLGTAISLAGCDIGATLAFALGRTLGKEWAQQQIKKNKKFALINLAVEKNAWLIIFLVRLSPILPFGLCNYAFGVSKVKFVSYWSATTLGLVPCTVAYTYVGSLMRDLTDIYSKNSNDASGKYAIAAALVVTITAMAVITIVTKRTLDRTMKEQEEELAADCELEVVDKDKEALIQRQPFLAGSPISGPTNSRLKASKEVLNPELLMV